MIVNIPRIKGNRVFLSILRTDPVAVSKYMLWMSDESTCVNIEMNDKVVDVTAMPGWITDHSVMRMGICIKAPVEDCNGDGDGDGTTMIGYCHIDHRSKADAAWLSINIGDDAARGHGYGKEVIQLLTEFCFDELGVESVHMDVLETNEAGIKCYQKVGYQISGRYRKHCIHKGQRLDWLHMDMIRSEWESKIDDTL